MEVSLCREVNYGDDQISEKIQSGDMEEMMQAVVISEIPDLMVHDQEV